MNRSTTTRRLGRLAAISMVSLLGFTGLDAFTSMASASEGGRSRSEHHEGSRGRWHRDSYRHREGAERDDDHRDCGRGNPTPPPAPYAAPVITVSADGTGVVTLSWNPPANAPATVTTYVVFWTSPTKSGSFPAPLLTGSFENVAEGGTDESGAYTAYVVPMAGSTPLGASAPVTFHLL